MYLTGSDLLGENHGHTPLGNWVILPLCLTEYLAKFVTVYGSIWGVGSNPEKVVGWGYRANLSLSNSNRINLTLRLSQEKLYFKYYKGSLFTIEPNEVQFFFPEALPRPFDILIGRIFSVENNGPGTDLELAFILGVYSLHFSLFTAINPLVTLHSQTTARIFHQVYWFKSLRRVAWGMKPAQYGAHDLHDDKPKLEQFWGFI